VDKNSKGKRWFTLSSNIRANFKHRGIKMRVEKDFNEVPLEPEFQHPNNQKKETH